MTGLTQQTLLVADWRTSLQQFASVLKVDLGDVIRFGSRIVAIWGLAWVAQRIVRLVARRIELAVDDGDPNTTTDEEKRGRTIAGLLRTVGRVLIVAVAVLLSVNVFVDIGPLLAGAGILGLAFSFGAQSLVKDVISGFFILVEDQFRVGDVIEAGGKSGLVERMSLRLVMLRDSGGALHMIPNGSIATVSNFTRGWSRAVVDVGVAYEDDIDRAIAVVRSEAAALAADPAWRPRLDGEPDVLGVEQLADSAVVIRTLLRTKAGQHWPVAREFRRRLKVRFDREHIEIPYQKRKVQVTISGGADPNEVAAQAAGGAA
jgi:small conductance mechanosensitive channel